ncbi:MAG: Asp-tRNA(Asn)/Glu-tRNA(Gln) amidotransferase subunit GatA [Conexivisphaerales archaeon]
MNFNGYDLTSILDMVKSGSTDIIDVNEWFYRKSMELNGKINAYITLIEPDRSKIGGKLGGLAIAVKDNISTMGIRTTCASKMLESYIPVYDATVIQKLKQNGGRIIGKTNMDEFAMGSSGENSAFGPTRNPKNIEYVTGGSSSGSAAAVAGDMAPAALGTDTGGSVRAPASFTGIIGFKPTYGAISRYGLIAYANSLEGVGLLTKSVMDAELMFRLIAGKDRLDCTSVNVAFNDKQPRKKISLAVIKSLVKGVASEVRQVFESSVSRLEQNNFIINEITDIKGIKQALNAYYVIACAEASTNLSRYDGIRYGPKGDVSIDWKTYIANSRSQFGKEVKARIIMGTYLLSKGYYETYYLRALQVRKNLTYAFESILKDNDAIYLPTMPVLPWKIGDKLNDPMSIYLSDALTVTPNLAGLPAISIPIGEKYGLPVGGQLIGKYMDDISLLSIAQRAGEVIKK